MLPNNINVLLVEDTVSNTEAISLILIGEGYNVSTLSENISLNSIKILRPQIILLDLLLKGCNGWEICRQMKNDDELSNIPVILVSATMDLEKTAKNLKADDYLEKPFDMQVLINKVGLLLSDRK
jgi:DNA-binding response OmpR family regulator